MKHSMFQPELGCANGVFNTSMAATQKNDVKNAHRNKTETRKVQTMLAWMEPKLCLFEWVSCNLNHDCRYVCKAQLAMARRPGTTVSA